MVIRRICAFAGTLTNRINTLANELDWLKRQIFGQKSERRLIDNPAQMALDAVLADPATIAPSPASPQVVSAHVRRKPGTDAAQSESVSFFDASLVPMYTVVVTTPRMDALAPEAYEVFHAEPMSVRAAGCRQDAECTLVPQVYTLAPC
ncbi:MAG: transposase [Rhodanobacteraceae bacterium]|nr:transposase [Rhodanobacteraceae bacterium]